MEIISRQCAIAKGLAEYFTGKPCNRGLIAVRTVKDKHCQCDAHVAQRLGAQRKRYLANREHRIAKAAENRIANLEQHRAYRRRHYEENRSAYIERAARWAAANPDRVREVGRNWAKASRDKAAAQARLRQARQLQATPGWLGAEDRAAMRKLYSEASRLTRETGVRHEVDHIVPLRGRAVSGLHVPANLRVMTSAANRAKSNRFKPYNELTYGASNGRP